jgi:hypothetical protein
VREIGNQVPTDQELAAYLDESLRSSSISLLADYPQNQKHYQHEIVEALAYMSSHPVSSEFVSKLRSSIFLSLQRLNQLPRTNDFWNGTNFRPTIPKVGEFCDQILSHDADDVTSLLTITAMTIFHTGEFQRGRWTQLRSLNAVSLEWVVFAAMFMESCGADDSREFADFVRSSGSESTITPILEEISENGGRLLSEWSRKVLALLATH